MYRAKERERWKRKRESKELNRGKGKRNEDWIREMKKRKGLKWTLFKNRDRDEGE